MLSIHSPKHIRCISRRGDFGPIFRQKKCGLYPGKYGSCCFPAISSSYRDSHRRMFSSSDDVLLTDRILDGARHLGMKVHVDATVTRLPVHSGETLRVARNRFEEHHYEARHRILNTTTKHVTGYSTNRGVNTWLLITSSTEPSGAHM